MSNVWDAIVVGSGAAAVSAAQPLVLAGLHVAMLDIGDQPAPAAATPPCKPWRDLRRTDSEQWRYFLGERFEGLALGSLEDGLPLTPPRRYVAERAASLLPRRGAGFAGFESSAQGGLAAAWGAAAAPWGRGDFAGLPISFDDLRPHYDAVAEFVGLCGEAGDDLSPGTYDPPSMMPPLRLEASCEAVIRAYRRKNSELLRAGLRLGPARLAACSREFRGRGPHPYSDMDFWCDHSRAVYRPQWTLAELRESPNFEYLPGHLVTRFAEEEDGVRVRSMRLATGVEVEHRAHALVLAAGALGSARLVLRSLNRFNVRRPLVSNASPYFPLLNLSMWGATWHDERHSLTQLTGFYQPTDLAEPVQLQVYSYRSHLLFKLIKERALSVPETLRALRSALPMITLMSVHHPDEPTPSKSVHLAATGGGGQVPADQIVLEYAATPAESERQLRVEAEVLRVMRRLGCWKLPGKPVRLAPGASIHYAGPLPMRERPAELECDPRGRLHGHQRVSIADSALFPRLPAKSVTFTMMASAHRVGALLAAELAAATPRAVSPLGVTKPAPAQEAVP